MEIPNNSVELVSSNRGDYWYLIDGGWDRIDVLGIRRQWAQENPEPPGWRQWRQEDVPNEARRQTITGQEAHRTLMDDMLNHEAEA